MARIFSVALITAGLLILADAGITLAWQEPISSIYGSIKQSAASKQLDQLESTFLADPAVSDVGSSDHKGLARQADELASIYADKIRNGQGIGRIKVPSVGIDFVLIQGTEEADLQKGPGHYPETGLPGQMRTIGIAGHRTTYLAPFRDIANIKVGDEVILEVPYGTFTYVVDKTDIVDPTETDVVDDTGSERVVLTACHPLYSAAQRYVVTAKLSEIELKTAD